MSSAADADKVTQLLSLLPSLISMARSSLIWGVDLERQDKGTEAVIQKFLKAHSTLPSLQTSRTALSLTKALEWQRLTRPDSCMKQALTIVAEAAVARITRLEDRNVLWVMVDERIIRSFSSSYEDFMSHKGLTHLGLAVMETLARQIIADVCAGNTESDQGAICIVEFKLAPAPAVRLQTRSFRDHVILRLSGLLSSLVRHYPSLIEEFYVINPSEEYLLGLDVPDRFLAHTTLLPSREDLAHYLGEAVPLDYGGKSPPLVEHDCLIRSESAAQQKEKYGLSKLQEVEPDPDTSVAINEAGQDEVANTESSPPSQPGLRLIFSEEIGPPTIILDPEDLKTASELCPGKMGARIVWAESDMLVKYGPGVRLAEAEAMHLVSHNTSIAIPKLLSAYILDGVAYIVMSYEKGEPFQDYWDCASDLQQQHVLHQLQDYVTQMRSITGEFIGGIDSSCCRDGIFEGGWGDYQLYQYGPYASEAEFNEGIVQALRDRLPPQSRGKEESFDSDFFNAEYILYQTVRELRGHAIVFSHGDLHTGNMLIRSDGTVVVLDWGLAGYWPEYWEFYRAMFNPPWRSAWDRMVEKFIPPYYVEYSIMKKVFGTVWN
ncbi:kinase-like protein [Aspergillus homomorphus CBS 101889]|uniref:Kinase-like protein n=1 Tax=Aspergillus homomorphus (strain CBS 101889) TaxID=1450537 RepID=A0A395HGE0_ASPHC|nr:kinase-like protein [Aspergillus homomorphus CBS 101889]RAL06972.1 kinase-like protein [Aspergillus homomorphus CBS 101889]